MNKVNFQKQDKALIKTFNDREVRDMVRYYGSVRYLDIRDKLIIVMLLDTGIRNSRIMWTFNVRHPIRSYFLLEEKEIKKEWFQFLLY